MKMEIKGYVKHSVEKLSKKLRKFLPVETLQIVEGKGVNGIAFLYLIKENLLEIKMKLGPCKILEKIIKEEKLDLHAMMLLVTLFYKMTDCEYVRRQKQRKLHKTTCNIMPLRALKLHL